MLEGDTLADPPLLIAMFPGVITPVPPVNDALSCDEPPVVIVAGDAVKLEIDASATTVSDPVP